MRKDTHIYVKPVLDGLKIVGWTWEMLHGGRLVDWGRTPQPTIQHARDEGISRTTTATYPGSYPEWERFWNTEEERYARERSSESPVAPGRDAGGSEGAPGSVPGAAGAGSDPDRSER